MTVPGCTAWPSSRTRTWTLACAVDVSDVLFLLLESVCVNRPTSKEVLINRSFWLAVLMVLNSSVCQPAVPLVFGSSVRLEVLAGTFEDDRPCRSTGPVANNRSSRVTG